MGCQLEKRKKLNKCMKMNKKLGLVVALVILIFSATIFFSFFSSSSKSSFFSFSSSNPRTSGVTSEKEIEFVPSNWEIDVEVKSSNFFTKLRNSVYSVYIAKDTYSQGEHPSGYLWGDVEAVSSDTFGEEQETVPMCDGDSVEVGVGIRNEDGEYVTGDTREATECTSVDLYWSVKIPEDADLGDYKANGYYRYAGISYRSTDFGEKVLRSLKLQRTQTMTE